jgi:DNA helicase-2/ATP-dependent DNA helicase PcrA
MLYIACTRAMHELHLTHDGHLSRFLEVATAANSRLGVDGSRDDAAGIHHRATAARVG